MKLLQRTKEVEVKGVKFTIGYIRGIEWAAISSRWNFAFEPLYSFMRKTPPEVLEKMAVEERMEKAFSGFTSDDVERQNRDIYKCYFEAVRFAVRGHSGFFDEDGSEIPFKVLSDATVDPELVEAYGVSGLLMPLALEVQAFNQLRDVHKKN